MYANLEEHFSCCTNNIKNPVTLCCNFATAYLTKPIFERKTTRHDVLRPTVFDHAAHQRSNLEQTCSNTDYLLPVGKRTTAGYYKVRRIQKGIAIDKTQQNSLHDNYDKKKDKINNDIARILSK